MAVIGINYTGANYDYDLQCFDMKIPETYIFEETFKSYDDALKCVNKLKEEDKKITVLEEKIHTL
jgi:hypothetical protein